MGVLNHYIQGSFTADGNAHLLNIRSGVDYIEVDNLTQIATPTNGTGVMFRWQNGMPAGSALQQTVNGSGVVTTNQITSNGFTFVNTSDPQTPGVQLSGTAISSATPPVVSSANTGSLANGNIVEIYNAAGAAQFNGYQFTVSNVTANSVFTLAYAPTIVAGTTMNYRIIPNQPMFYPRNLLIASISQATSAVVTFTVTHNLTVGQYIVFGTIPSMYGMTQISGLRGLITAINTTTNSVTVNINTTGFTAFAFPLTATAAATAHTLPSVVPFADGPSPASNPLGNQNVLDGATRNTAIIGVQLGAGANGPAGQNGDVIYWRAWKAEQIQTTFYS
jgi:hypothetical protein